MSYLDQHHSVRADELVVGDHVVDYVVTYADYPPTYRWAEVRGIDRYSTFIKLYLASGRQQFFRSFQDVAIRVCNCPQQQHVAHDR